MEDFKCVIKLMNDMSNDIGTQTYFFRGRDISECAGLYDGKFIFINSDLMNEDIEVLLSAFFHEYTHALHHRRGSYASLYLDIEKAKNRHAEILRMEKATDRQARKLMYIYFPELEYEQAY